MLTEADNILIATDLYLKVIDNRKSKKYTKYSELDTEDQQRMDIIQKIEPNRFSWYKGKVEEWITNSV